MSKCTSCRKDDAIVTQWEKIKYWLLYRLFPREVAELIQEKYTQGFGDGRKVGYKQCADQQKTREEVMNESFKEGLGDWFKPFKE